MDTQTYAETIDSANAAVEFAQEVRELHRKRTKRGSYTREADLRMALHRLKLAMRPIRSELARLPYRAHDELDAQLLDFKHAEALRETSQDIQRERRKLWKMLAKKRPKRKRRKTPAGRDRTSPTGV